MDNSYMSPSIQKVIAALSASSLSPHTALIHEAASENTENLDVLFNIAIDCAQNNRLEQAIGILNELALFKEKDPGIFYSLGFIYSLKNEHLKALTFYDQALLLDPKDCAALINRGASLNELKRYEEALAPLDQAISLNPAMAEAWSNKGTALNELKRYEEALTHYNKALELNPSYAEAWSNKGVTLAELKRFDEALSLYDKALVLNPDDVETWSNKGTALNELKRYEAAVQSFWQVVTLNPQFPFGKGMLMHAKLHACDWSGIDDLYRSICQDIAENKKSADPFGFQGICDDEGLLKKCAEIFSLTKFPPLENMGHGQAPKPHSKIRIGYLCGEFREQATAILMTELWELHDKKQFEIYAFDNGWDDKSPRRKRIENVFDELIDISRMSDDQATRVIQDKEIDILINLNGFFGRPRQGIFARKPAPIQVNYLGFPGTIGANYIDYLIADRVVIPDDSRQYYCEKIVRLPHCYQTNDSKRQIADRQFTREEFGLPQEGFVFCCFNNSYKILPQTFDIWMRLLHSVPGSVLWLIEDNLEATQNLKKEAKARGIDTERLIFAKRIPLPDHLARHRCADLFLDTLPYNAHTTASDALWAGLPIITLTGTSFAGRVATSMLRSMDLAELITQTPEAYQALAIQLATHRELLDQIKRKLAQNCITSPLFNTPLFAKNIEAAYTAMYERNQAGLPPEHIDIKD
jgi:protein O-GlcNAc transferase